MMRNAPISALLVDDDPIFLKEAKEFIVKAFSGLFVVDKLWTFTEPEAALDWLDSEVNHPELLFLDIKLEVGGKEWREGGLTILEHIRSSEKLRHLAVVGMSQYVTVDYQRRFIVNGGDGFLHKPNDFNTKGVRAFERVLTRAMDIAGARHKYWHRYGLRIERRDDPSHRAPLEIDGVSPAMMHYFRSLFRVALDSACPNILITGERGTGKTLAARVIHAIGHRWHRPFLQIDLNTIPETLVLSELFGIEKRVATGVDPREGLILKANTGILFLDEIADLSPASQAMLLAVLRDREFRSIGQPDFKPVDFQLICATNENLEELVAVGEFRSDLYDRIRGEHIHVPSLTERFNSETINGKKASEEYSEIDCLIDRELWRLGNEQDSERIKQDMTAENTPPPLFSVLSEARKVLRQHNWPDNFAGFQTVMLQLLGFSSTVVSADVVRHLLRQSPPVTKDERLQRLLDTVPLETAETCFKDMHIGYWYQRCNSDQAKTAKAIGKSYDTIHRWVKERKTTLGQS